MQIPVDRVRLLGDLAIPPAAKGLVVFVHGSGSSRLSPRNQFVAREIQESGVGTLLFDLLTREEEDEDARTGHLRFDIELLARRLVAATRWITNRTDTQDLSLGYFGASTGGAAALVAAAETGPTINAVVSRGGRPDMAGATLMRVQAPTLLIVGERDDVVLKLNHDAYQKLKCDKQLLIVPRATHLFEEPGTLKVVATAAAEWFQHYLKSRVPSRSGRG